MDEVFAGFLCGYILALVLAPALAVALVRARVPGGLLERLLPPTVSLPALAFVLHGGLFLVWSAIGMVLGLLLLAFEDGSSGLGSRNLPFTLVVVGLTAAFLAPVATVVRPLRRPLAAVGLLVAALFGWLMPHLATWSSFSSS